MDTQKRQGDLLIIEAGGLPEGSLPAAGLVLAEGEATGHAHRLDRGQLFRAPGGRLFFCNEQEAVLAHEEHAALRFPPGTYEVRRQREYAPEQDREVRD